MDVRAWLEQLGLGRYADAFEANDIDEATLRGLSAEDLRELGIGSLGHRKRIIEAISRLASGPEPLAASPARRVEPERRQVVVFFADICGFTELSGAVGAETARRIVEAFLNRADP
jgi:class 3 adenylate cyclase